MSLQILSRKVVIAWLAGVLSSGLLALGVAAYVIFGGGYNTSARKQHTWAVAWASHTTMTNSVAGRAKYVRPPRALTSAEASAGVRTYETHCMFCHGGPAIARAKWAGAMVPTPPFLLDASRQWSREELYVIIRDGIKMTGMPAWGEVIPDQEIWNVVALIELLPSLSPRDFARMRSRVQAGIGQTP